MSIIRNGILSADLDAPITAPTLNLDFANSQSLDPRITFTRGSIGTRVNKNGLIEIVPANQPRFDYDPISGECKGLLIEEQRTNLVTNSTSATFTGLTGLSTTTDGSLAPDGNPAIVYIPTTSATYHASNSDFCTLNLDTVGIATGSSLDVTYSMWIKDYNSSDLGVYFVTQADISGTSPSYALRIAKPKAPTWIGGTLNTGWTRNYEKIVPYQNGWYRFIQSYRYTRQTSYNRLAFYIQIYNNRNVQTYRGDGTSGIYIWGPQVETAVSPSQAPFETSYIPTSGSQVTRSPDLARLQEPYFSPIFNKYEGSVSVNYNIDNPVDTGTVYGLQRTQTLFYIGDKNDVTYQGYGVNISRSTAFVHRLSGQAFTQTANASTGSVYALNSPINNGKFCFTYDQNKLKVSCDALSNITSLNRLGTYNQQQSITTQVFNELTIGWGNNSGFGNRYITGTIKSLQYYPKALNDAEMLYLTR
jgi:hypothetical protein